MIHEKIGSVILDYSYYEGEDLYSDGIIEDEIFEIVKKGDKDKALFSSNNWSVLYHLSDIRENLLEWYSFCNNARILEIGAGCGAITGLLSKKASEVISIELSKKRSLINAYKNRKCENIKIMVGNFQDMKLDGKFDYITLIGVWEYAKLYVDNTQPYLKMLEIAKGYLKPTGKIIIAIENKMGLKYWNGAPEDHTANLYSGLNDYIDSNKVRTFSKQEIEKILTKAGIVKYKFYYPMPDYKLPEVIYSDEQLPMPGWERNYGKDYSLHRIYNFYDAIVSDQICADNMFPYFANSFLIVTGETESKKNYVKYNKMRKEQYRIKTEILEESNAKYVKKTALNITAKKHILELKEKEEKWKNSYPKLNCVEGYIKEDSYITPYINGTDLETVFYQYRNSPQLFTKRFVYYWNNYLTPSNNQLIPFCISDEFVSVFGEEYPLNQMALKYTNIDMIFSNFKVTEDNQLYCFDYEWILNFLIPHEYVIWRSAKFLYEKYRMYLKQGMSKVEFYISIGISEKNISIYEKMEKNFMDYVLKNANYLDNYRKKSIRQTICFD